MPQAASLLKRSIYYVALGLLVKGIFSEVKMARKGTRRSILKYDGISVYRGILNAYRAPLKWTYQEFLLVGGVVAGVSLIYLIDEKLSNWFAGREAKANPLLKDFGWYYGSPENHYAINGGFYLYGVLSKEENVRKTGVLLISSTCATGLLQTILKILIGRARPLKNEGKASFKPFSKENSYYSFPSGHSILSFTTAYALGTQFRNPTFKIIIYAFGFIAPFSRFWARAHWVSDAAASLSLSIPIVNRIEKYLKEERNYPSGLDSF